MATGVDAKLLKSTKFPPEFNQKVDMQKVNLQVMKKCVSPSPSLSRFPSRSRAMCANELLSLWARWIANRVTEILGSEDDVVIELVFNLIEGARHVSFAALGDLTYVKGNCVLTRGDMDGPGRYSPILSRCRSS
jgi:serine/arginine repetitive matrix protein 1